MRRNLSVPALVAAVLVALSLEGSPAAEPLSRTVTVTAERDVKVVPDQVVISLRVVTSREDLVQAQAENDAQTRFVLALGEKYGIAPQSFSVEKLELTFTGSPSKLSSLSSGGPAGGSVERRIDVTLHDFATLVPFVSHALSTGAAHLERIDFRNTRRREHQFEARRRAMTAATEKAGHLASLSGLKLGKPLSVEAELLSRNGGGVQPETWNLGHTVRTDGRVKVHLTAFPFSKSAAVPRNTGGSTGPQPAATRQPIAAQPPIAPGLLTLRARVTVTFEMFE